MRLKLFATILLISHFALTAGAQYPEIENNLDRKVMSFLEENANNWRDMNVSLADGRILYDIIINNGYKKAVEIGTSTGHSAIWIAWALSKTGGKLVTIEIDKRRWLQAKSNFKKAGLEKYIDARLGDAHDIVPRLTGKYDFVFSDADKFWYKNYFIAMDPKLEVGGCFAAHNTAIRIHGIREFLEYVKSRHNYKTVINQESQSGISLSYKISGKSSES
jgi:caffeoyl-CoA O-methyltransferase